MDSFELTCVFPVSASTVYKAWMDSEKHSLMTGGMAAVEEKVGSYFTAWDGYITGKTLGFDKDKGILQSWRTTEFPPDSENSNIELRFEEHEDGCKMILIHSEIPGNQGEKYAKGWETHYFKPMREFFSRL